MAGWRRYVTLSGVTTPEDQPPVEHIVIIEGRRPLPLIVSTLAIVLIVALVLFGYVLR